ncbi:hypothetical protein PENTCL1PPCAC_11160, partial [Pristionchus entomophagus]
FGHFASFSMDSIVLLKMLPIESPESLTSWLTKELSPICDADPGALAKYVLALLKKPDKSNDEIKEVCMLQLEVFLQSHTKRFVEKLFTALGEKSYVDAPADPPTPVESTSTGAPVEERKEKKEERKEKEKKKEAPKEKQNEERKEKSKEKDPSPPHSAPGSQSSSSISNDRPRRTAPSSSTSSLTKREGGSTSDSAAPSTSSTRRSPVRAPRKRVSPPVQMSRRRSRSPPARGGNRRVGGVRRSPIREKRRSRSRSPIEKERRRERGERDDEQPRRKKRCRDFDEQGVCLRGEACPYDHGLDPVVVENAALAAMGLKGPGGVTNATYSVPPPGYNPMPTNPAPPGVDTVGYNPEAPGLGMGDFSVPPPPIPVPGGWRQTNPYAMQPQMGYEPSGSIPVDPHSVGAPMMGGMGGVMRGRGRGRGRGGYHPYGRGGGVHGGGGEDGSPKEVLAAPVAARTLIIKKIPAELNNISKLNEHFEQFGSITNMQVHYERQPDTALITFSSRFEAMKAYKNPEPIFSNRFIRVFWYANVTGEGGSNKTTLSSGVTVETPEVSSMQSGHAPSAPREPVVLPGPGQTKYRKPEAVEAFKKKQEVAAVRKADKEGVLRQKDLLRRTTRILCSLQDQQKQVIMAMMKETDAEKKKTLNKMYKTLDGKISSQKGDVEEQQEKLKTLEAKVTKNETEGGMEGGSSSGDEALLSPDEGIVKGEEEHEDDLLSAQVDEEFTAIK